MKILATFAFLLGFTASAQSKIAPPALAEDCQTSLRQIARPESVRKQIADDLLKTGLLFREQSFNAFLNLYSEAILDIKTPGLSIWRIRRTFPTLGKDVRRSLAETIWRQFVSDAGLEKEVNDGEIARFANENHLAPEEARSLFLRLRNYHADKKLHEEVMNSIEAGIPTFLALAPLYARHAQIWPVKFVVNLIDEGSFSRRQQSYAEIRWQRYALLTAVVGSVWATFHFGVPWDHYVDGVDYWHIPYYSSRPDRYQDLAWYKTTAVASVLGIPFFYYSYKYLRPLFRKVVVEPLFNWRFRRLVRKNKILAAIDRDLQEPIPLMLEERLERTVEDLTLEAKNKMRERLDPASPAYRDSDFADYGDVNVGERNFIASNQLFAIERLIDNRANLTDLAAEIRQALAAGKIGKSNQLEYLRVVYGAVNRRQKLLQWSQEHIRVLGSLLFETRDALNALLEYADAPAMRERRAKSPLIDRNILLQVGSLQEQQQASLLLLQALEKIDQRRTLQYASLAKVASTLTMLNAGGDGKSDTKADWNALADALAGL